VNRKGVCHKEINNNKYVKQKKIKKIKIKRSGEWCTCLLTKHCHPKAYPVERQLARQPVNLYYDIGYESAHERRTTNYRHPPRTAAEVHSEEYLPLQSCTQERVTALEWVLNDNCTTSCRSRHCREGLEDLSSSELQELGVKVQKDGRHIIALRDAELVKQAAVEALMSGVASASTLGGEESIRAWRKGVLSL